MLRSIKTIFPIFGKNSIVKAEFDIEENYKLPIEEEGVINLLVEELKRRIEKQKLFLVRVSRTANVVYLHTIMYAEHVEFNRVSEHYTHPSIIRVLCVLRDLKREGDYTISYYDSNKNTIEEHRFTTLSSFLTHLDTLESRILDSGQLNYRKIKPYPMGTLSQQHSLVSLLHFQQDFKSELIAKKGYNGEVLRDCQLVYETPEQQEVPQNTQARTQNVAYQQQQQRRQQSSGQVPRQQQSTQGRPQPRQASQQGVPTSPMRSYPEPQQPRTQSRPQQANQPIQRQQPTRQQSNGGIPLSTTMMRTNNQSQDY